MHKVYVKRIIEKGDKEDMELLEHVFDKAMTHIKECDNNMYNKLEDKLYIACYGKVLTDERAKDIVKNMRPYGMKWTIEDTRNVQSQYGLSNIRDVDFFIVMNSAYNDYHDLFDDDVEMYMKYTKAFIKDDDAVEDKVFEYFTNIPKKD